MGNNPWNTALPNQPSRVFPRGPLRLRLTPNPAGLTAERWPSGLSLLREQQPTRE